MIDPAKGSEFRIALKPLEILKSESCANYAKEITLIVPIRNDNIENLRHWLMEQGIINVIIKAVKFERQLDNGNHKSKYEFIKDLIEFYKQSRVLIPKNTEDANVIFKCGQVNWFFYLLFLVFFKREKSENIICAPVSGFSYIKLHDCIGLPFRSKLYYRCYNGIIWIARKFFKHLFIPNKKYHFLFATYSDCKIFFPEKYMSRIYSEIDLHSGLYDDVGIANDDLNSEMIKGDKSLLWSGHLVQRKNPLLAVTIISKLLEMDKELDVVFVGEGPLNREVELAMAAFGLTTNERFTYMPKLPRPKFLQLIKQVDFVLITSLREVNSLFFLEALAVSKIVIALKNSGLKDFDLANVHLIDTKLIHSENGITAFVNRVLQEKSTNFMDTSKVLELRGKLERNNFINLLESL